MFIAKLMTKDVNIYSSSILKLQLIKKNSVLLYIFKPVS